MNNYIIYEKEGPIVTLTLNRPEKLNAFVIIGDETVNDIPEFLEALKRAEDDDEVKVVIIKGAGRSFCAGHDLTKVGFVYGFGTKADDPRPSQRVRLRSDRYGLEGLHALFNYSKLTIAQVHGHAVAGGMYMAMFCDFLICANDAKIGATEQRLGFAGGGAVIFPLLVYCVGLRRACDLFITGRVISGKEAVEIGLATKAVEPDKLEEEVRNLAKALSIQPRDGIAIGKAHRHLCYDAMGLSTMPTISYVTHTLFTNLQYAPDEWIFFKERREKGTKAAFHERDKMFDSALGEKPEE